MNKILKKARTIYLHHPQIGGHDLVLEVHLDELRQLEAQPHGEGFCVVDDGSNQSVVVAEEIVIESLRVWIRLDVFNTSWNNNQMENESYGKVELSE